MFGWTDIIGHQLSNNNLTEKFRNGRSRIIVVRGQFFKPTKRSPEGPSMSLIKIKVEMFGFGILNERVAKESAFSHKQTLVVSKPQSSFHGPIFVAAKCITC